MGEIQEALIYGAGAIGRSVLPKVHEKYPGAACLFVDGNPNLWGREVEGTQIICPDAIPDHPNATVVVATSNGYESVMKKLREIGVAPERIDDSFVKKGFETTYEMRNLFLQMLAEIVNRRGITGSCAEGGVFEGYFAKRINAAFPDRQLYLFDTFEGFAASDIAKEKGFTSTRTGDFNVGITPEKVLSEMPYPEKIIIRKGFFPDTAVGIEDTFVFVNLDFDLYEPTRKGLEFFFPRMARGGVILVHDYYSGFGNKEYSFLGVKDAVDEFCADNDAYFLPVCDKLSIAIIKP